MMNRHEIKVVVDGHLSPAVSTWAWALVGTASRAGQELAELVPYMESAEYDEASMEQRNHVDSHYDMLVDELGEAAAVLQQLGAEAAKREFWAVLAAYLPNDAFENEREAIERSRIELVAVMA